MSFLYPEAAEPTNHIDLNIEPGETVALVGASGSGKTTLTHLLPRFYDVNEGAVLLDGIDIRDMTLDSLRSQIALVSQDVVLFNDTVAANIAYGPMSDVSRAEIERAATEAHAMDFIRNLPQGLDTDIGENGILLSGGQRQRLAIARAFLKRAPVLILDEATSALDSVSEQHVQAALEELRKGRTTLIVAHRLSTVREQTASWFYPMALSPRWARMRSCLPATRFMRASTGSNSTASKWIAGTRCERYGGASGHLASH